MALPVVSQMKPSISCGVSEDETLSLMSKKEARPAVNGMSSTEKARKFGKRLGVFDPP